MAEKVTPQRFLFHFNNGILTYDIWIDILYMAYNVHLIWFGKEMYHYHVFHVIHMINSMEQLGEI